MNSKVNEIAPDVYRISTFHPEYGIQFNQILIKDDELFLMHTGFKKMFSNTLEAVSSVIAPSSLRWIGFSHFESDECGALNEWLGIAPLAKDMPYTNYTNSTLQRLAALEPRTLATMHGSSFRGDGRAAIVSLAEVIKETIGKQ